MPQVWDSRLHVVKNSLKFEMCVVLGCSSPQCYHYHNNLFLLLSFSFKKNLLSNMLKYVSCVNRHFIVPLFFVCIYRTRSFPFSTLCHQENLSTILHFQGVSRGGTVAICSLIIYFQVSTFATIWVEIFFIGTNTNFTYLYVVRSKICIDLGWTSHLVVPNYWFGIHFIGIFTMNVIPKILPSQMEMYFLMLGKFNVLSKIN